MARPLIPFVQNGYYASRNWIPLVKGNGFTTSGGGEQEEVWETASGSVVTFDAIAAPLRQLSVAVEPVQAGSGDPSPDNVRPITGWNSVTVNRTGRNLLDFTDYSTWEDGYLRADGTPSGTAAVAPAYERCSPFIPIKGGQAYTLSYVFSGTLPSGSAASNNVCFYDAGKNLVGSRTSVGSATTVTATAPSAAAYMRFSIRTYNIAENYQLELGSTATAYEPYSGNEYTIQLGETVYGGTLDVVNGKMTVDRAQIVLNGTQQANSFNWRPSETSVGVLFPYSLTNNFIPTSGAVPNGLISDKAISCSYNNQWDKIYDCSVGLAPNSNFGISLRIPDPTATTAALVNAYLSANPITVVYPLATPFELTLTPEQISTLQGTNNVWSDAGDVTVEYRAQ